MFCIISFDCYTVTFRYFIIVTSRRTVIYRIKIVQLNPIRKWKLLVTKIIDLSSKTVNTQRNSDTTIECDRPSLSFIVDVPVEMSLEYAVNLII